MDANTYIQEAEVERDHWWFKGRRALFARLIKGCGIERTTRTLDIGTSTGTNLRMLGELDFSDVMGLDNSPHAVQFCKSKGLGEVQLGDICQLPFDDGTFGLVLATDVVEHVEDDARAVGEIARILEPGGTVLLTVPAFQSLWGLQDDVSHHHRRYKGREITARVEGAGLVVERAFYFNFLLFPTIWLARQVIAVLGIKLKSEAQVNTPWINTVLECLFRFDVAMAPRLSPPFGVSFLVLAKKSAP